MISDYLFSDTESIPRKIALKSKYGKIWLDWASQECDTTLCKR